MQAPRVAFVTLPAGALILALSVSPLPRGLQSVRPLLVLEGVLLAVVLALLFLAGSPQHVFFAGLLAAARLGHFVLLEREGRRDRARLAGKGIAWLALGLLFCAPQLFPTLELIGQMQRGTAEDRGFSSEYPLPPQRVYEILLSPEVSHVPEYFWEHCGYVGERRFF